MTALPLTIAAVFAALFAAWGAIPVADENGQHVEPVDWEFALGAIGVGLLLMISAQVMA